MFALYSFARTTDDLGDSHDPMRIRTQRLEWWREATRINVPTLAANPPTAIEFPTVSPSMEGIITDGLDLKHRAEVVFPSLRDTVARFKIPPHYFLEIIDGVMADQQKTRFDTYEQLEHYCYLVASAVGLACLHVWQFDGDLPLQAAIDCGIAFQLTNILRDIVEDSKRGRIYLPRQHFERHGLGEDDLLFPRKDDRLCCLILDEASRAEALYQSGWKVWEKLHPDGRRMFSMMWRTYRELLSQIQQDPMRVVTRRVTVPITRQANLAIHHFIPRLFAKLPVPPSEN